MHYEQKGIRLWIEPDERLADGAIESSSDLNLTIGVEPADASNRVQVRYRVNGGPVAAIAAQPVRHVGNAQYFKAQLPCVALRNGDTVEYGAVCQCAGRQVPSAVEAEQFAASFRVISSSAPGGSTAAVGSAMRMELAPAMASHLELDSWSQTAQTYTKRPNATHLSLFVLEQNTGRPIAQMPFFAEVGVFLSPPKFECKLGDVILSVLREFYTRPQSEGVPKGNLQTLAEPVCELLSRLLSPEVIDHMVRDPTYAALIIRAILQKTTALATSHPANDLEALRKLLEEAILAYAKEQDLPLAESDDQTQRIVWAHPLGVLATDHAGYLSFDLTRLPTNVADALALALEARRRDPNTATDTSIWLYPMAREANKIDALTQGRFAHDAIVVKIELERPVLSSTVENLGILSMQNPNLTDWRLSPGSFATNPGALIGDDGCEILLPANVAVQEFYFYQIIRLNDAEGAVPPALRDRVKLGVVHEYRLAWYPLGHSLGQILYSLPLAPGESVNLAVIDWTRRDDAERKEHTTVDEQLVHNEHRDRTISETVNAAVHEYQHGSTFMAGLSGAYGGSGDGIAAGIAGSLGGGTSNSSGSRDVAATTVQRLSDNITQASSSMRELKSTVVVHSTQSEKEAIETRTVVNYNHSHALTILYYEVLRHFRVATDLARRRPAVLVKMKTDWFDGALAAKNIRDHRAALQSALLDTRFAEGFDAVERLSQRGGDLADFTKVLVIPTAPKADTDPRPPYFHYFTFEMTTGGFIRDALYDNQNVDVMSTLLLKDDGFVDLKNAEGGEILNNFGAFTLPDSINTFTAVPRDRRSISWDLITGVALAIAVFPSDDEKAKASFSRIKLTGFDAGGGPGVVLVDQSYEHGHLVVRKAENEKGRKIQFPTQRPGPSPAPPPVYAAADIADHAKARALIAHVSEHKTFYGRAILLNQNPVERASELDSLGVLEHLDNRPLDVIGDYVAYPCTDPTWKSMIESLMNPPPALSAYQKPPVADELDERLITLPTRGVFAEAKLGHCNASEEIDNTRFWDWQQSPIPHFAPEIAPTVPVTPQPQQQNLSPTPFPSPIVNIVNPPNEPDPTGMAAAMGVLSASNIFRDMSGRSETADILKNLADNAAKIAAGASAARAAQFGAGGGSIGGARAMANQPSATNRDLQDFGNVLGGAQAQGLISPEAAQKAYGDALASVTKPAMGDALSSTDLSSGEFIPFVDAKRLHPKVAAVLSGFMTAPLDSWRHMIARFVLTELSADRLIGIVLASEAADIRAKFISTADDPQPDGASAATFFDNNIGIGGAVAVTIAARATNGGRVVYILLSLPGLNGTARVTRTSKGTSVAVSLEETLVHELTHVRNQPNQQILLMFPDSSASIYVDPTLAAARTAANAANPNFSTGQMLRRFTEEITARHVHWRVRTELGTRPILNVSIKPAQLAIAVQEYFQELRGVFDGKDNNGYVKAIVARGISAQLNQIAMWLNVCSFYNFSDRPEQDGEARQIFRVASNWAIEEAAKSPPLADIVEAEGLAPLLRDFV